jgi:hypothetical protein
VENPEWRTLADRQNALFPLPSASTLSVRLDKRVKDLEGTYLKDIVPGSKVALALDCWSSTGRLSFIAVTVYFIDKDWNHHEVLIGFEHLEGVHTGVELARVINGVVTKAGLEGRIISITTDNASNNSTMVSEFNELLHEVVRESRILGGHVQQIPCLAHVLQLILKDMLGSLRICPKNEIFEKNWHEDQELSDIEKMEKDYNRGIPWTLAKVSRASPLSHNLSSNLIGRFVH